VTSDDIHYLSAIELAAAIKSKELSPVEVTAATLARIEQLNPQLNCFCTSMADEARADAKEAEAVVMRGDELGPLHGVPVSVKDIVAVKDSRTTSGSQLLKDYVTRDDAPSIARLRKAGAILIGRTNTPEFGWKGVTDSPLFGITRNPWNTDLTPGGSSGGAAAAVAAGMGPIGIGTDGGGSVRIPAAFCGLVGMKASFGRIANFPATPVDSLRHTGPLTRTVADAALAVDIMSGPDERDPCCLPCPGINYLAELNAGIENVCIAYSPDLGYAVVDPEIARLCEASANRLRDAGAVVEQVDLGWHDPYDCWVSFFYGGIAAVHCRRPPEELDLLDPGLRKLVDAAANLTAVDLVKATLVRNAFWQRVWPLYEKYDLLITPALAVQPFAVGQNNADPPGEPEARHLRWSAFTYPFNLTGQPACAVPCGWSESELPIGLQIIGRRFDDLTVLRAARALEQLQPWSDRRPVISGKQ
jgi:aspartyl-tRNA(Asn)/glutamyl-tRNA(Gln) amidotransferase subunit A